MNALTDPIHLQPGSLPRSWPHVPLDPARHQFHVHAYNANLVILRQSGYTHVEKPFLYLLLGSDRALLVDTGAPGVDVGAVVSRLLDAWAADAGRGRPRLIVTHTHGHSDHVAGDAQFAGQGETDVVPATVDAAQSRFGITQWPDGVGALDLGDRVLDVVPVPGHDATSVAFYDRNTGVLLAGDVLYPGRLYVRDAHAFRDSVRRLLAFTAARPVAHILGAHIENARTPFVDYPEGTVSQPDEHDLALGRAHLLELDQTLSSLDLDHLPRVALRDFTIWPVPPTPEA